MAERNYQKTEMKKERILQCLRERGCRITKQRELLLDVILQENCASCKEIYYQVKKIDANIGTATIYRMINLLEEIGAISRKNMYKISFYRNGQQEKTCMIELEDHTVCQLSIQEWHQVILEGLKACGYIDGDNNTIIEEIYQ